MNKTLNLLIALSLSAVPGAAQISDAGFSASLLTPPDALEIGIERIGPVEPASQQSCADAAGLEKSKFTLSFETGRGETHLLFTYAGCREEPRNDYLPPYTERYYRAPDGYTLTLVTEEGADRSAVVLSTKEAVWAYGEVPNQKLTTSGTVDLGKARLRVQGEVPDLKACEAAMTKSLSPALASFGARGFDAVGYRERGPVGVSLVLLTGTDAYYYYEACDICADVDKCDLKTGVVSSAVHAHSAGCADLSKVSREGVVYDACGKP